MTLAVLDLVVAFTAAAAWIGGGATSAAGRSRVALGLAAAGALAALGRAAVTAALARHGWWFVQEKVTLALPLLAAGLVAVMRSRSAVPLFFAGYSASAGFLVTLLIGYPVGWAAGLITVALVGAATLVTARRAGRVPVALVLSVGLAGVVVAVVVPGPAAHHDHGGTPVTALRGATGPAPGRTVRRYDLTARKATVGGFEAWTFNGQVPGPPITAGTGDLIEVTLRNADIGAGVTLHWHGYDVPAGEDGVPGLTQDAVKPGGTFVYRFLAGRSGTYWYHTHEASSEGVRRGLYGALVVTPRGRAPSGLDLTVPVHTLDGRTVLGGPDRRTVPAGTPVRLRLINTDSGPHRLALAGVGYRVVSLDGTDLVGPGPLDGVALRLPAGGRYDVAFAMPAGGVSLLVDGAAALGMTSGAADPPEPRTGGWPEFDPLSYGSPAPAPFGPDSRFDRRFTLVLDRAFSLAGGRPRYAYTINGRAYPSVPAMVVREGDLVLMTVANRGLETHPWHLHGHRVLVLSRDGRAPTGSPLWMDTFDVRPGEVWRVAFRADNPGLWMNHCHNLAHADKGMMLHLAYEGIASAHGV